MAYSYKELSIAFKKTGVGLFHPTQANMYKYITEWVEQVSE